MSRLVAVGIAIVAAAAAAACSCSSKKAPEVGKDAAPLRAVDAALEPETARTRAVAAQIEEAAATQSWEQVLRLFVALPASSATRARLDSTFQTARAAWLADRERSSTVAVEARHCVRAREVAAVVRRRLPGDAGPFDERAATCRSVAAEPTLEAPDYATARWEPLAVPRNAVFYLPDGSALGPETAAQLLEIYAAVILIEPDLVIRLESAAATGAAAGAAEQAAAKAADALVALGVDRARIDVVVKSSRNRNHTVVGLGLMRALPPVPVPSGPIPTDVTQLVVGIADHWESTAATLIRYERIGNAWRAVGEPVAAALGHAGSAWGRGLHGAGAPPARPSTLIKREGDGRAPAGAFRVVRAYGYADDPVPGATLRYKKIDEHWRCVDDPASVHYTRILDARRMTPDWSSAEEMRRSDEQYRWVIVLDHNGGIAVPGGGSCIFFHIWEGPGDTTAGCTAMAQPDLEALLAWLRPGAVYVLLPRNEHAALATAWALP